MSEPIECFLVERTEYVQRVLRRYRSSAEKCSAPENPWGYCNAVVVIEPKLHKPTPPQESDGQLRTDRYRDDPRWPAACPFCGRAFDVGGPLEQVLDHRLYENVSRGILTTLDWGETPVGAMWWAEWYRGGSRYWQERGGGPHLIVQTPGGPWDIDTQSNNGEGWQRTGEPPKVTATPSIGMGEGPGGYKYHGWLRDGFLVEA